MTKQPVYVLLDVTIRDKAKFFAYVEGHKPSLHQYGGKLLFRSNDLETVEGDWLPKLFVVQEWQDEEAFHAWYQSTEYSPWKKMRKAAMDVNMVLARKMT